jgi:hypothetical protein
MASYELQVGTTPGGSNVFTGNVGNVLTRTVTGSSGQTLYARVRGRDKAGNIGAWSANSDGIAVDTQGPRLTSVAARDYATLEITFDEPVNNADKAANYACARNLRILGAMQLTNSRYRLYTTDQQPGTSYTLTVKGPVKDHAGNAIRPSDSSRAFVGGAKTGVGSWELYR